MRIAIIGSVPGEWFSGLAGLRCRPGNTTSWNANLARGLAGIAGNQVHFITVSPCVKSRQDVIIDGIKIHILPCMPKTRFLFLFQEHRFRVRRMLREIDPDIVHGQGTEHPFAYLALDSAYPAVVTIHCIVEELLARSDTSLANHFRHRFFHALEKWILPKAANIIVTTRYMQEFYAARYPHAEIDVIGNAVDEIFFRAASQRPETIDKLNWTFVGRISREKGIEDLLQALALVHASGHKVRLSIVGPDIDSSYRESLNGLASSLQLAEFVTFAGRKSQSEVAAVLAASYALVLPSRYEAFGLVLAESMATGTPVVANAVGGIPHVVGHGSTGLLAEPGNPASLAGYICQLIESPALREKLAQSALQSASKRFSSSGIAQQTMGVYRKALAGYSRS